MKRKGFYIWPNLHTHTKKFSTKFKPENITEVGNQTSYNLWNLYKCEEMCVCTFLKAFLNSFNPTREIVFIISWTMLLKHTLLHESCMRLSKREREKKNIYRWTMEEWENKQNRKILRHNIRSIVERIKNFPQHDIKLRRLTTVGDYLLHKHLKIYEKQKREREEIEGERKSKEWKKKFAHNDDDNRATFIRA